MKTLPKNLILLVCALELGSGVKLALSPSSTGLRVKGRAPASIAATQPKLTQPSVQEVIDGHIEWLGNEEYNYREFLWRLAMEPKRKYPPFSSLTDDEAVSIMAYTTNLYEELNSRLRNREPLEELSVIVDAINSGLAKLPNFQGVVYRSVRNLPEAFLAAHVRGQVIAYPSFTSASSRAFHDQLFGPEHFIIHSKTGKDISPLSIHFQSDSEREVLFKAPTRFRVKSLEGFQAHEVYVLEEWEDAKNERDAGR